MTRTHIPQSALYSTGVTPPRLPLRRRIWPGRRASIAPDAHIKVLACHAKGSHVRLRATVGGDGYRRRQIRASELGPYA
ncbi:hypothetical protein NOCA1190032 [metagenome]|uniref:Uncharacterized protein n=1 Tax=metagenome TaxID=256318 RepID=A0A2P2CCG6_9ZZZZ